MRRVRKNRNGWIHQFLPHTATPISIPSEGRCSILRAQLLVSFQSKFVDHESRSCSEIHVPDAVLLAFKCYDSPARNYQLWSTESDGVALDQTPQCSIPQTDTLWMGLTAIPIILNQPHTQQCGYVIHLKTGPLIFGNSIAKFQLTSQGELK